jgi:hypothetical protein
MAPAIFGLATTTRTPAPHARTALRRAVRLRHRVIIALIKMLAAGRRRAPALLTDIPTTGAFPILLARAWPGGAGAFMPLALKGNTRPSRQLAGCAKWITAAPHGHHSDGERPQTSLLAHAWPGVVGALPPL